MESDWYAVYTRSYHEQKLVDCIKKLSDDSTFEYEAYLPTVMEETQWSDRKKKKSVPLFKNYVFVKHDDNGFGKIKRLPGFCDYVRFEAYPAIIKQEQIVMIKNALEFSEVGIASKKLMKGERVKICHGPMKDYEGILVEDQQNSKVAIEVEYFNQCLLINVVHDNLIKI